MTQLKQHAEATAYVALGSNIGDREHSLVSGMTALKKLGTLQAISSFYDTVAVGPVVQPNFLNAVVQLRTAIAPQTLMEGLLRIELDHGRIRNSTLPKGPRTLDLDLLAYDDIIMRTAELTLPHPAIADRFFVLIPLAEIAPDWLHPVRRQTAAQLLTELSCLFPRGSRDVRRMDRPVSG